MSKQIIICSLSILLFAGLALAHGDFTHLMGTVTAIGADTVTIKDTAGKSVVVMMPKTVKYFVEKKTVAKDEVKVGTRVVIDAKMDEKMKMYTAEEVHVGATKPAEHAEHK